MSLEIFESTFHWKNNACINPFYVERWHYVEGFKRAGEILADEVIKTQRDNEVVGDGATKDRRVFFQK